MTFHKVWVYMLKYKSEAFETFKHFKVIVVEKQTGKKIKRLTMDNGIEFVLASVTSSAKRKAS